MTLRIAAFLAVAVVAVSCGGPAGYGESCGKADDCANAMSCPTAGPMSGKCTKSCTKDEECTAIGGGVCSSDVCNPPK